LTCGYETCRRWPLTFPQVTAMGANSHSEFPV
jgi:hypothetical protein